MRIALFTSNQPRHLNLINKLSEICDELFVVSEVTTVFPGLTQDFYNKSEVMKTYFGKMQTAEHTVFGRVNYLKRNNVRLLSVKMGDLNDLPFETFSDLESVDVCIVFGASWIKGPLCDLLIKKRAVNIHMGVSPYYRGATCNFWAIFDNNAHMVGATIHYLSKGLDSGAMIMHALPRPQRVDAFELGMRAVESAHEALCKIISTNELFKFEPALQDKTQQIRYSKRLEFNDDVALKYLENDYSPTSILEKCNSRDLKQFLRPFLF